jgi:hypothetical protein
MLYPGNFEHDLVEMPFVVNPGKMATDLIGKLLAELARPLSDGFVANDDAASRQQLLPMRSPSGRRKYNHTAWPMISAESRYPA